MTRHAMPTTVANVGYRVDKKTERTKYFWLDGGSLYLYTIYMPTNLCLNVVAGNEGEPEAVLLRAVQIIEGEDLVWKLRDIKSKKSEDLANGPGKIGQALGIDKEKMNGIDLLRGPCRIVDGGIKDFEVGVSKRVNIDYAEEWIDKEWRFYIKNNSFVSKPPTEKSKEATKQKKAEKSLSKAKSKPS
jgi:DNA-3-methyladenine glycosylase